MNKQELEYLANFDLGASDKELTEFSEAVERWIKL